MDKIVANSDDDELNEILDNEDAMTSSNPRVRKSVEESSYFDDDYDEDMKKIGMSCMSGYKQWTTSDGNIFIPAATTKEELTPGVYDIKTSERIGVFFERIPVRTEGLIEFPNTTSQMVVDEIQRFWELEKTFKDFGMAYKRGILLWGPPGGGKSSLIQIITRNIIENKNGVVFNFDNPKLFKEGVRIFRKVQPNTPLVVLFEDIDSIIQEWSESQVLNILDGVESIHNMVFLATTNYPGKLGDRIVNRPSRFDKRFKIGFLDDACRKLFFEKIISEKIIKEKNIDIDKWVADTKNFPISHLKELFIAVIILGDSYENALSTLKKMKEKIDSKDDGDGPKVGFTPR